MVLRMTITWENYNTTQSRTLDRRKDPYLAFTVFIHVWYFVMGNLVEYYRAITRLYCVYICTTTVHAVPLMVNILDGKSMPALEVNWFYGDGGLRN